MTQAEPDLAPSPAAGALLPVAAPLKPPTRGSAATTVRRLQHTISLELAALVERVRAFVATAKVGWWGCWVGG